MRLAFLALLACIAVGCSGKSDKIELTARELNPDLKSTPLIEDVIDEAELGLPRGSAIDDTSRFYVADISLHGVQVYHTVAAGDREPKYIGRFGVEGSADGAFLFPNAVAVDGRSRIYVADWRNGRIQVWGY